MRRFARQQAEDFVAHLTRAAFVGVEAENPFVAAGLHRAIAQVAKPFKWHLHDARAEAGRDLGGAVVAVGIGDDDLVGPQHAFDGGFNLGRFVEADNIGRDRVHAAFAYAGCLWRER